MNKLSLIVLITFASIVSSVYLLGFSNVGSRIANVSQTATNTLGTTAINPSQNTNKQLVAVNPVVSGNVSAYEGENEIENDDDSDNRIVSGQSAPVNPPQTTTVNPPQTTQQPPAATTPVVKTSPVFTLSEVAKHSTPSDCYLVINNKVYNVSSFIGSHPGGARNITNNCGKEVTGIFAQIHSNRAWDLLIKYYIGSIQ